MNTDAREEIATTVERIDADETFDRLAQVGLAARGVVYLTFGIIVFNLARGDDGAGSPSAEGALGELAGKSYGGALLLLLAIGLASYSAACAAGAIRGSGGKRPGESDTSDRVVDAGRAVVNAGLALAAFRIFQEGRDAADTGSEEEQRFTAQLLDWPGGRWLVVAVAVAVAAWGCSQIKKAVTGSFEKGLSLGSLSARVRSGLLWFGRAGFTARGLVFLLVSWFLVRAGLDHNPGDAVGMDGALRRVVEAEWGPALLTAVGLGVVAFGCWSIVEARYRRSSASSSLT